MTEKKQRFVEAYLTNGHNATQAAIAAGYSARTAYSAGSRLRKDVEVQHRLNVRRAEVTAQLEAETGLTLKMVVDQLARIGFSDPALCFGEDGNLLPIKDMPGEFRAALAGFEAIDKFDDDGHCTRTHKLRITDRVAALIALGKHLGGFKEKVEVEDVTPKADVIPLLSDADLATVRAAIETIRTAAKAKKPGKGGRRG